MSADGGAVAISDLLKPKLAVVLASAVLCSVSCGKEDGLAGTVPIPGGTFLMGTAAAGIPVLKEDYGVDFAGVFENEAPSHPVTLSDFRIDRYEVTHARFAEFLRAVPHWQKSQLPEDRHNGNYLANWASGNFPEGAADLPVVFVTWSSAQAYCRWRGGRLPTEAEWEYVARSGDDREFPWGNDLPSPELANYSASGIDRAIEVGRYPPNPWGVHDLAGNVWEFLLDKWTDNHAAAGQIDPLVGGPVPDDRIASVEGRRSVRGASFGGSVVNLRTRWRDSHVATNAIEFVGFRCAYPSVRMPV